MRQSHPTLGIMGLMKPSGTKAARASTAAQSTAWAALVPLGFIKPIIPRAGVWLSLIAID